MKKIVVLIFVVMAALSAKAQFYVGGNVALWHNDDADNTSFLIEPEFGYNFSERWAVGATLGFAHIRGEKRNVSICGRLEND